MDWWFRARLLDGFTCVEAAQSEAQGRFEVFDRDNLLVRQVDNRDRHIPGICLSEIP